MIIQSSSLLKMENTKRNIIYLYNYRDIVYTNVYRQPFTGACVGIYALKVRENERLTSRVNKAINYYCLIT